MSRIMAILPSVYADLQEARELLLEAAHTFPTTAARQEAQADLMASAQSYLTPAPGDLVKLEVVDGVAHIPIVGVLTPHANPCAALTMEAQTEYGYIQAATAAAEADPSVEKILYHIDSPGGNVSGLDVTAQAIASATKRTEAIVGTQAASAAYWLAAQVDHITASSPLSEIGSIGVVYQQDDDSAAVAKSGIVRHTIVSTDAPDKRPDLSTDTGRASIQANVDDLHSVFVRRVAEGRHVTADKVKKDFGRGGVLIAEKALAAGMIDEVVGAHLSRTSPAGVASSAAATSAAIPCKEVRMDLNQLKAEHPDVYAKAEQAGIDKERARVASLRNWVKADPQNAKLATVVAEAEAQGKTEAEIMPQLQVAIRSVAIDTPPDVPTKAAVTGSGADATMTDDELVAAATALALGKEVK